MYMSVEEQKQGKKHQQKIRQLSNLKYFEKKNHKHFFSIKNNAASNPVVNLNSRTLPPLCAGLNIETGEKLPQSGY